MQFSFRREQERLAVRLVGRLDEEAAGRLCDGLLALSLEPGRRVEVDLAGVSYIGSVGIAKLIVLRNHFAGRNSALRLVNPPAHIFDLFESLRLDKLFGMKRP